MLHEEIKKMNHKEWYEKNKPKYENLASKTGLILEGLIEERNIDHLSVVSRVKSSKSFDEKIIQKCYENPATELHDFAGIRVIVYIESDVLKVSDLIYEAFHVHMDKSLNKSDELGINKIGYRSIHLICDLGEGRTKLPEYSTYKDLLFEIQIRTVLQHAWAEIEHDRNYKFSGILPAPLQRRLHLAAGTLELIDREFDSLAKDVEKYAKDVVKKTNRGNLDIEINTTSLTEFLKQRLSNKIELRFGHINGPTVLGELNSFGIKTLKDINLLLTDDFFEAYHKYRSGEDTDAGFLRDIMMFKNFNLYFEKCWQNAWNASGPWILNFLSAKYKKANLIEQFERLNIKIDPKYDEKMNEVLK